MINELKIVGCFIVIIALFFVWYYLLGEVKLSAPHETEREKRLRNYRTVKANKRRLKKEEK